MKHIQTQLAKMSIDEKLHILAGSGFGNNGAARPPMNLKKDVSGVAGYINGVHNEKLDIPATALADGPAGVRIIADSDEATAHYNSTAWPIGSLLASTWDSDLITEVGKAFGEEIRDLGVDFILAPGQDIQRNPLNGRNFEYYSEDPLLTGRSSAAIVRGIQSNGVGATIKHFVANNSETNRQQVNEIITPRSLREIYLRGFQIAIAEGKPWALMTSYNQVNGAYNNARSDLLLSILRDEWHFEGLVMTDWFAGDTDQPGTQVAAGNDMIQPGGDQVFQNLKTAYDNGVLTDEMVDRSVSRILEQVCRTPGYLMQDFAGSVQHKDEHLALVRRAAAEGMVLLKNDQALPAEPRETMAVFGINQVNTYKGGTGSGDVNVSSTATLADGLSSQFDCDSKLLTFYTDYFEQNRVASNGGLGVSNGYTCDEPTIDDDAMTQYANSNDIAVICIGRQAGEGADRANEAGDYLLSDAETTLLQQVATTFHDQQKKVVVVLNVNGVVDTSWADDVDAIVLAYMPGQDGTYAVADILSGKTNPCGKLAQTFPVSYEDVPSASTFPGVDTTDDGAVDTEYYNEGIYVGYRYYTTFNHDVAYPFGFGLSYSNFELSDQRIVADHLSLGQYGNLVLTASVTNTGKVAGKEVAQVYVSAPQGALDKPAIELKSYAKTKLLHPGETQELVFLIPSELLASFDPEHERWLIEAGHYQFFISNSSDVSNTRPLDLNITKEIALMKTTSGALALPDDVSEDSFVTVTQ